MGLVETCSEDAMAFRVCVIYSPRAGETNEVEVSLSSGATVWDSLLRSGLTLRHPDLDLSQARLGIWGKPCWANQRLRDGDRIEVYRPLHTDPKEARRKRCQSQRHGSRKNVQLPQIKV
jgi:uncharacterized protein